MEEKYLEGSPYFVKGETTLEVWRDQGAVDVPDVLKMRCDEQWTIPT